MIIFVMYEMMEDVVCKVVVLIKGEGYFVGEL